MIYPQRSKSKKIYSPKVVFVVSFFVILFLLQYFLGVSIKNIVYFVYKPVFVVKENIAKPFTGIQNFFKTKNSVINENTYLHDELTKLQLKEYDYNLLQKENDDLKNQLGRDDKNIKVIANIVAKPPLSPYDTFLIDVGSKNGVVLNSIVYISDKIVVGVVTEVRKSSSVVGLFSKSGVNTNVVLERTGTSYNIVGQGGQNYKLEVPKDTDLVWGDLFTYPDGQRSIVGMVYYIDTNSQSAFKTAYIRPPVNIFSYKTVLIEREN